MPVTVGEICVPKRRSPPASNSALHWRQGEVLLSGLRGREIAKHTVHAQQFVG